MWVPAAVWQPCEPCYLLNLPPSLLSSPSQVFRFPAAAVVVVVCCYRNCSDNVVVVDVTVSVAAPTAIVTSPAYSLTTLLGTIKHKCTLHSKHAPYCCVAICCHLKCLSRSAIQRQFDIVRNPGGRFTEYLTTVLRLFTTVPQLRSTYDGRLI